MSSSVVSAVMVPADESRPLEAVPISADPTVDDLENFVKNLQEEGTIVEDVRQRLFVRPGSDGAGSAGLYAYDVVIVGTNAEEATIHKNVRASRLAMACGLFSHKLHGNILLVRASIASRVDLQLDHVLGACCISPDLRSTVQQQLKKPVLSYSNVPTLLGNALQQNYHDKAVLSKLANVMMSLDGDDDGEDDNDEDSSDSDCSQQNASTAQNTNNGIKQHSATASHDSRGSRIECVTKEPLCLHCRKPADTLCPDCKACYFCDTPERRCRRIGWTHACLCPTWKFYTNRRRELSTFPFLSTWTQQLTTAAFQSSEKPYEDFLNQHLLNTGGSGDNTSSWWSTELYGWAGGTSRSAETVNMSIRRTYMEGFAPLLEIPPQRRVEEEDLQRANASMAQKITRNAVGLLQLSSWEQYYILRHIPASSPVALLCTFPLTLYYAITQWGEVPCTVARMLQRPLRLHIVGVEKEANFLDLFQEVGYLLPEDLKVEMTFIVREDMLPSGTQEANKQGHHHIFTIHLCSNVSMSVVSGTYGDSLDPNFDCGGPPDMIIGLNAGLYAYESWRSVVTYLYHNPGVIGVFSDYNEYSGLNCAGLGGQASRESLCVNPFRQPRAMPVYSMNLPQFSNGFLYVMNAQELE